MAKELPPYKCGHCASGRHRLTAFDPLHCRGIYGGVACRCDCNAETPGMLILPMASQIATGTV